MKIYTSYFAKYKELLENNIFPMSISRVTPEFCPGIPKMLGLAPSLEMLTHFKRVKPKPEGLSRVEYISELTKYIQDYTREYTRTVLFKYAGRIDELLKEIIQCAQMQGYDEVRYPGGIALLCYESPDKFCHRLIIRSTLNDILNKEHQIKEWNCDDNDIVITL